MPTLAEKNALRMRENRKRKRDESLLREASANNKAAGRGGRPLGSNKFSDEHIAAIRSGQPDSNCFRCGARGWCDHRQP